MRVLITGGAGFVGANLGIALAERHPDWELVASTTSTGAAPSSTCRAWTRAGVAFVHGDVREPRGALGDRRESTRWSSARPSRRCWPAPTASTAYAVQTNLIGAYNCLELARRDGAAARLPLDQPRLPDRGLSRSSPTTRRPTRFELADEQAVAGASPAGISEDFPLDGARTPLRRDQARRRAADRGVRRGLRPADGGRPLRRDRRALADGQGRPGRVHPLAACTTTSAARSATSATAARASRCATCCTSTTWSSWSTSSSATRRAGRRFVQRRRRPGQQPLAARDDRDLPGADRPRGPDRARCRRPGRATSRSTSRTAPGSSSARTGARSRDPRRTLADIHALDHLERGQPGRGARARRGGKGDLRCRSRSSPAPAA